MKSDNEIRIERQLIADYQKLYRLAYSYVHNENDALDIVQESAYKAVKNSHTLKNLQYAGTWIYRIVINESISFLRKQKIKSKYFSGCKCGIRTPLKRGPHKAECALWGEEKSENRWNILQRIWNIVFCTSTICAQQTANTWRKRPKDFFDKLRPPKGGLFL